LGDPSKELYHTMERPENFYMLSSIRLTSSISLGLALSQVRKVVCLDGDGSILMNMGSLSTIANMKPTNLILVALDNGAYGTTGNQRTFTSGTTDLPEIARASGFDYCLKAENTAELTEAFIRCLEKSALSFIHVTIESDDVKLSALPLDPIAIKNRFMDSIDP